MEKTKKIIRKKKTREEKYITLNEKLKRCIHSRFCEVFGEYKCLKLEHRIINAEADCVKCPYCRLHPKPDEKELCQCSFCVERRSAMDVDLSETACCCNMEKKK